ncbi:MAG TPA: hypothetical protein VFT29_01470 [Gemmatimonadaceae bacterium]|nr:hypothetical protein [Gemmatimonadaceae bacterium]
MRHLWRAVIATVALAHAVACADNGPEPALIPGTYGLEQIAGNALPYADGSGETFTNGTIVFAADQRYTRTTSSETAGGLLHSTIESGVWTQRGSNLQLAGVHSLTATIHNGVITIALNNLDWTYRRQ